MKITKGNLIGALFIVIILCLYVVHVAKLSPIQVGVLQQLPEGLQFNRNIGSSDHKFPMFVQKYLNGKPMWGFILVSNMKDVKHIVVGLGMKPVGYGNFMDNKYADGPWTYPILDYSTGELTNPLTRKQVDFDETFGPNFYLPVWLDRRT